MAKKKFNCIFKCKNSGNIVEMIHPGEDVDVSALNNLKAKDEGDGAAKHQPVITRTDNAYNVKVGEVEHPMDENHYIAMIELIADGQIHKQYLCPGDKPEATFEIPEASCVLAREYCTVHGLWKS